MYDLVLKGGRVIDGSQSLDIPHDLAIQGGTIARLAPTIPREEARRVIEVPGTVVTPGLIDLGLLPNFPPFISRVRSGLTCPAKPSQPVVEFSSCVIRLRPDLPAVW